MTLDGIGDTFHAGLQDAARHGEVEAHIALGVTDEEAVADLKQDARLVGEEAGQIIHIGQAFRQIHRPDPSGGVVGDYTRAVSSPVDRRTSSQGRQSRWSSRLPC